MEKYRRYISALIIAYANISVAKEDKKKAPEAVPPKPPDKREDNEPAVMIINFAPILCCCRNIYSRYV